MGVPKDYTGQRFGILTAVKDTGKRRKHNAIWLFKCDCGKECEKVIADVKSDAKIGRTPSCGCLYHQHRVESGFRHGFARHPMYRIWQGMKQRCYDKSVKQYKNYGGRGIKVCARWLRGFVYFYEDMHPTWKKGLSIDRIDVNGDYCPENCRWADAKVQGRNKRTNHIILGMTVTEFAEKCGIDRGTIYARIRGGVPEELLGTPVGQLPDWWLNTDRRPTWRTKEVRKKQSTTVCTTKDPIK